MRWRKSRPDVPALPSFIVLSFRRVLHTKVSKKHRVPVEVRLYCNDMNIEKVDNILDEHGLALNGSFHDISFDSLEPDDDFSDMLSEEQVRCTINYLSQLMRLWHISF